jgi:hypothetical protein
MDAYVTHSELCEWWPSDVALAADLRIPEITDAAVAKWRQRNFIPPWWWPEFVAAVQRIHGVTITFEQMTMATRFRAAEFRIRHRARRNAEMRRLTSKKENANA